MVGESFSRIIQGGLGNSFYARQLNPFNFFLNHQGAKAQRITKKYMGSYCFTLCFFVALSLRGSKDTFTILIYHD
jgi:hypothetical protein